MKTDRLPRRAMALLLAALLLCSACSGGPAEAGPGDVPVQATTMSLKRVQGTVGVTDGEGKGLEPLEDLGLFSGYQVDTRSESYAWIDLDDVKLTKMDQDSGVKIQKEGKHLTIEVTSGSLFFHITEPLAEDETLDIRTSSMIVGIRGTCGWVSAQEDGAQVYVLEGTVTATVDEGSSAADSGTAGASASSWAVSAGEMAETAVSEDGSTSITVSRFPVQAVPQFVLTEVEEDEALAAAILEQSGLDVLDPADTPDPKELLEAAYTAYVTAAHSHTELGAAGGAYIPNGRVDWAAWIRDIQITSEWSMDFVKANDRYYYTCRDLNGDGEDEMIMGFRVTADSPVEPLIIHSRFDHDTDAEVLTLDVSYSAVLNDGLVLELEESGTPGYVSRLDSVIQVWLIISDSDIPQGMSLDELDLSSHGGLLRDHAEWIHVEWDGPRPETVQNASLPTDGDRIVFTGTIDLYDRAQVEELQGEPDPNGAWSDPNDRFRLILLDAPQDMELRSGDGMSSRSGSVWVVNVTYAEGLEQYDGQHLTFSIDPTVTWWPSDTSIPLGQPSTSDVHVLG